MTTPRKTKILYVTLSITSISQCILIQLSAHTQSQVQCLRKFWSGSKVQSFGWKIQKLFNNSLVSKYKVNLLLNMSYIASIDIVKT